MRGDIDVLLGRLGFGQRVDVRGRAALEPWPARLSCGVYLLHLADGGCYVGQSTDLPRRFGLLRRVIPAIEQLSLQPLPADPQLLDVREQAAIDTLAQADIPLLNQIHPLLSPRSSELDLLVPPHEQRAWLASNPVAPPTDDHTRPAVTLDAHRATAPCYARLQRRPDFPLLLELLGCYLRGAVPWPRRTELAFWSIGCMPTASAADWPRLACLSMSLQDVLVVGHSRREPARLWVSLTLARDAFRERFPTDARFHRRHPRVGLEPAAASDGPARLRLTFPDAEHALYGLGDPDLLRPARLMALHLMRTRRSLHRQQHCFLLADRLLGG
ncbi:MAG TPA: hypothetical protein VFS21_14245 [Roseiflexaceae bacterium]|nr:hypothetical protein [Roseiflexaceae bacterium]